MPSETFEVKKYHSNKIKFAIEKKAFESADDSLSKQLYDSIQSKIGLSKSSKKVSMILNNTVQPTVHELAIIAQVLGTSNLWELIKLEE